MAYQPPFWLTVLCIMCVVTVAGIYLQSDSSSVGASTPTLLPPPPPERNPLLTITPPPPQIMAPSVDPGFWPIPTPAEIPGSRFPRIEPQEGSGMSTLQITSSFPFGGYGNATIIVPVNMGVYRGAKSADKKITLYSQVSRELLLKTYYLSFIADIHQDSFFESLLRELRVYRTQWNLDNDSYVELLAVFVQSIPYRIQDGGSRFPVETFVEYQGDCDDKTVLLASLLAREGYNISIFHFEEERHVALGIASTSLAYKDTGYAYLETTVHSLVGVPPATINGGDQIRSLPIVIPVGSGTMPYQRGDQVKRILAEEEAAYQAITSALADRSIDRKNLIDRIRSGELKERYLSQNGEDKDLPSFLDSLAIYYYIHTHTHDREGTYAWLEKGCHLEPGLCF